MEEGTEKKEDMEEKKQKGQRRESYSEIKLEIWSTMTHGEI
jgi:hypothetical protein